MENLENALKDIENAENLLILEKIHKSLFSKTGFFVFSMKYLNGLPLSEKKAQAKELNTAKKQLLAAYEVKHKELVLADIKNKMSKDMMDLTLQVPSSQQGGLHPISYAQEQLISIFSQVGFVVAQGPEIETDWNNFTALNIPLHHPSRQEHDTFYMNSLDKNGNKHVLRTHTSPVQIRVMESQREQLAEGKPIKIIVPGRTYRSDSDATHSPMFHQIEGLYVDKKENVSVSSLRSILFYFCKKYFNVEENAIRFRPSYFPFTSPSYELDCLYDKKDDQLVLGQGSNWLEILGSGMVHPNVLENCKIDSNKYSGYAFGMGIERLLMLKYGFKDLRAMYDGDLRWLSYYNFNMIKTPTVWGGLN